ncbi:MAG: tRNA-specific adenosine deaminase [Acidobacteria bacterium]|nr:tRNA-specific adenosine deaminase [Acidobacteriota bacterium]
MERDQLDAWMEAAVEEAQAAATRGEVPVGAVVVLDGKIVGRAGNRTESDDDPSAHAEILALRDAGQAIGDWRIENATMIVTLEPCPMCLGAIVNARVRQLVYGAGDPRLGACGSAIPLPGTEHAPHLREVRHATHPECGELLRDFFRARRS